MRTQGSSIVTSNQSYGECGQVFGDEFATAAVIIVGDLPMPRATARMLLWLSRPKLCAGDVPMFVHAGVW